MCGSGVTLPPSFSLTEDLPPVCFSEMSFFPLYQLRLPVSARGVLMKRALSLVVFGGRNLITDCLIAPAPSTLLLKKH